MLTSFFSSSFFTIFFCEKKDCLDHEVLINMLKMEICNYLFCFLLLFDLVFWLLLRKGKSKDSVMC